MPGTDIGLKRAYEPVEESDGFRVLVERLWPRGVTKDEARIDFWAKETAPSKELRTWYAHDGDKWPEFQRRYRQELAANPEAVAELRETIAEKAAVTFVYGSRETVRNSANVLRDFLEKNRDSSQFLRGYQRNPAR